MHTFTQRDVAYDPDGEAAADWLRRFYLRSFVDRYQGWLDVHASWPLEWQEAADASDYMLPLSPARLQALQSELTAIVERYRDPDPADRAAQLIEIHLHAFPIEKAPR